MITNLIDIFMSSSNLKFISMGKYIISKNIYTQPLKMSSFALLKGEKVGKGLKSLPKGKQNLRRKVKCSDNALE